MNIPHLLPDEKLLFGQIADGDEAAFRKLFQAYMPMVFPMIAQVTKSGPAAEDIIQETFLRLWVHRDKLKEIQQPRAWILRIAYFQAFTYLRDQSIHSKAIDKLATVDEVNQADTDLQMMFRHTEALVRRAVDELPKQQKQAYRLSRESGYKTAEIARAMNLSEQSVKNTLVRALKFIRDYLEKAGYALLVLFLMNNRY
ncbi:sigma-70 family RNA polymerase sigma factor [Paraflavitalea sp. CAU 1676]|uniref:RNA polymerase sigma factor n=1 Tax=Paraflavitalea sp. CAU 1676 TaxID=3032598 RepID=UPI0023D9A6CA|nr:sigma-70 family RNA polymerase sigma factor [Paraflavitalea sp. CAU 1676]MDF2187935.1 sigma-70 family RNA polymerase sigma factor [Paraflavitalea sp. CAU 1676]